MKAVSFGKGYAIIGLNSIENNTGLLEKLFGPYEWDYKNIQFRQNKLYVA